MAVSKTVGEILFVNVKMRTAIVFDESAQRVLEVVLTPKCRDDDNRINTYEDIPKEGSKVLLHHVVGGETIIAGPAPLMSPNRKEDDLKIARKLTGINVGDPLLYGIVTDDLSPLEGFRPSVGEAFGSNDPIYSKELGSTQNHAGNSFGDLMPGDKQISTKDGNAIAVLEGGVNYFKASELCQIIGIKYNDLLRIISRNYEHFSDFGNVVVKNNSGVTSFIIEGSASYSESLAGRYTLRMVLGGEDGMYKCSVLDGNGGVLSEFHMEGNGNVGLKTRTYLHNVKGSKRTLISGEENKNVQGNHNSDYLSDVTRSIHGSETKTVSKNKVTNVINDYAVTVGRNKNDTISGVRTTSIVGSASSKADALKISIGSKEETIQSTGDFVRSILASGNFEDFTTSGNFSRSTVAGDISDSTVAGNLSRSTSAGKIEDSVIGDYNVSVTGGVLKLEANGNTIEMDQTSITVKDAVGGALKISTGRVALGNSAAELLSIVDKTLLNINRIVLAIAAHDHITTLPTLPTSPPRNLPDFLTIQTQLMTLKAKLALIKGSL